MKRVYFCRTCLWYLRRARAYVANQRDCRTNSSAAAFFNSVCENHFDPETYIDVLPQYRLIYLFAPKAASSGFFMLRKIARFLQAGRGLALIAGVLFAASSCSELAGDSGVSKQEPIRCQAGPDCDLKWERAYTWVVESSGLKMKTKTDGLIKTAESPGDDRMLVVTITKNPTSQPGSYEIDFIGKCLSIWSCIPSAAESRTKFENFVLAGE